MALKENPNNLDSSSVEKIASTVSPLNPADKKILSLVADTIRCLSMDAVERAGSGHAGTPMGCAEIGAYLYGKYLRYVSTNSTWENRDRFILSAGHASLLQYCCLHFAGLPISIEDLKQFRQLNSKTPSHPQYGITEGIESTTGVDGQGIAHGIGQALAFKCLGARFNRGSHSIYNQKVIVLAGDGCFMEGISHEASALAGHLKLNNIILVYDRNKTTLDGYTEESCSEDTKKRYEAYGWDVYEINGHDFDDLHSLFEKLRQKQSKPSLIIANTMIGKGAPTKAGSYLVHSEPVGKVEQKNAKEQLGFPDTAFYVPSEIYNFFSQKAVENQKIETLWNDVFQEWKNTYPDLYVEFKKMKDQWIPEDLEQHLCRLDISTPIAGRKASHQILNFLGTLLPGLYGGSADLARSDGTHMDCHTVVSATNLEGRNIKYGVREFGMGGMAIGMAATKMLRPFIGTFLSFSDYMSSAIRMSALMQVPVIYQLSHDSIFVGQDGPTHQPIEHLAYLRAIPHLQVIRPADANELKMAWLAALKYPGPTALILSRQPLPICLGTDTAFAEGVGKGAYIVKEGAKKQVEFTLIGTGSELSLALQVSDILENSNYSVRVLSMPSWDLFEKQSQEYKDHLLGDHSGIRISIEAASTMGWHKYVLNGKAIGLDTFGKSATPADLAKYFGFTSEAIAQQILKYLPRSKL